MSIPAIYYLCSDHDSPTGGFKMIYRHVELLSDNGFPAYVLHKNKPFRCTWFEHHAPLAYLSDFSLTDKDYLVFPEAWGPLISEVGKGIKKVIFNQNAYYTFDGYTLDKQNKTTPYVHPDTAAAITVSEDAMDYLAYVFPQLKTYHVRNAICPDIFSFSEKKQKQISFMTRKNRPQLEQVINILKFRNVLEDFELVPIENKNEKDVAAILKESLIFLSFGYPEGFNLPAAEAMSSGCLVIGYHGNGGRKFFLPEFSWPIQTGSVIDFARTVEQVLQWVRLQPGEMDHKRRKASEHICTHYSKDCMKEELLSAWKEIVYGV
ncbi:MAG: glycosyltransferase [Candidatus Aureabacteria bacterium]|nr:glycosyltransferase [Candidatus Auribacterota bacterium]